MTKALYKKGGRKKYQGHFCIRLDCSEDRVDELLDAGWALSPREACVTAKPKPMPLPDPKPEKIYDPLPIPKPRKKKSKKKDKSNEFLVEKANH